MGDLLCCILYDGGVCLLESFTAYMNCFIGMVGSNEGGENEMRTAITIILTVLVLGLGVYTLAFCSGLGDTSACKVIIGIIDR